MSSKHNPPPPTDMPVLTDENFGMELFWERHKNTILLGVIIILVAIVAVGSWLIYSHTSRQAAEQAFSQATTPEAWQEVIAKYPSSNPAASAHFLLAQSLREKGDFAGSTTQYEELIRVFPKHPLVGNARIGIAENLDAQGKSAEAAAALQVAANQDQSSFSGPLALLLEGRILLREGKTAEARKIFSRLRDADPDSLPGRVAISQLVQLDVVYSGPSQAAAEQPAKPQE